MDEKSKLRIMLFFNTLRKDMSSFDEAEFSREGRRYAENGYYYAVDKMNDIIQDFIDRDIDNE